MLERLFTIFYADRLCACGQRFGLCIDSKSGTFSPQGAKCVMILKVLLVLLYMQITSTSPITLQFNVSCLLSGQTGFNQRKILFFSPSVLSLLSYMCLCQKAVAWFVPQEQHPLPVPCCKTVQRIYSQVSPGGKQCTMYLQVTYWVCNTFYVDFRHFAHQLTNFTAPCGLFDTSSAMEQCL